jgi:SAM-dependent methyltransferase
VTGLDRSVSALQAARERATEAGVRLVLAAGDAAALPFAGATLDLVTAVTILCFVPAPEEAVREVARVLRPGGRLVLGELGRWSVWAAWRRVRGWLGDRTWARASFWTPGDLRQLALDAGLVPVRVGASVFHPPMGAVAAALAPLDPLVGRVTTFGAAFLVLEAEKPGRRAGS